MFVHLNINDTLYGYKSLYIYIWLYIMRFGGVKPQKSCFFFTFESKKRPAYVLDAKTGLWGDSTNPGLHWSAERLRLKRWKVSFGLVVKERYVLWIPIYIIYKYDANDQVSMQPDCFMMFALVSWYDFTHVENYSDVEGLWEAFVLQSSWTNQVCIRWHWWLYFHSFCVR